MRHIYRAPCGDLLIEVEGGLVCRCHWVFGESDNAVYCQGTKGIACGLSVEGNEGNGIVNGNADAAIMENVVSQLDEYFQGKRVSFDLPLSFNGSPFREKVWNALTDIPYGEVSSYAQLAESVGCRGGQRAAAQACSCNRLAVIVPCHRVVASDGSLGGYTITDVGKHRGCRPEGLAIKQFLLAHERQLKNINPG